MLSYSLRRQAGASQGGTAAAILMGCVSSTRDLAPVSTLAPPALNSDEFYFSLEHFKHEQHLVSGIYRTDAIWDLKEKTFKAGSDSFITSGSNRPFGTNEPMLCAPKSLLLGQRSIKRDGFHG